MGILGKYHILPKPPKKQEYIYIYKYIFELFDARPRDYISVDWSVVKVFANGLGDQGSILGRVI